MGDVDLKDLENLHNLVLEYKGNIFTNNDVQDVLLNDGYHPEGKRPTSFHDVYDAVFLRTKTSIHLGFLEKMIETATRPQLTIIKREEEGIVSSKGKGVLYPSNTAVKIDLETPEGYDTSKVEDIQIRWFEEPKIVENARNFQNNLNKAFEEFNLKFVLFRMHRSLGLFIPNDFGEVYNIQKRIIKAFGGKYDIMSSGNKLNALDNAYYNVGMSFFNQGGQYWGRLSESDFGRMFLLSPEEDQEAMNSVLRGR